MVDYLTMRWLFSLARELRNWAPFSHLSLILPSYAYFFESASSIWKPNKFSQSIS
ncbi:hypothetical protein HanIR_Chr06g0259951 [Helianthus annuus]|nr:hypothetical protein HanIR_Chr06g0259951 [Helianthus annuus]